MDNNIVKTAREWIGTPFHHQGRVKGVGVDCAGLIIGVAHELNITSFDYTSYGREPSKNMLMRLLDEHCDRIEELEPGCILLMRFIKEPQHLAIYTGTSIIHAYDKIGKCVEHSLDNKWKRRIVMMYRYK